MPNVAVKFYPQRATFFVMLVLFKVPCAEILHIGLPFKISWRRTGAITTKESSPDCDLLREVSPSGIIKAFRGFDKEWNKITW
jgi:hypothetical protein